MKLTAKFRNMDSQLSRYDTTQIINDHLIMNMEYDNNVYICHQRMGEEAFFQLQGMLMEVRLPPVIKDHK